MTIDLAPARDGSTPDHHSPRISPEAFKAVFRRHPAGVAVITLTHRGRPVGFTATSVISVSADPPLLAFSVDSRSSAWPGLAEAESLVINFLSADQVDVSARFATSGIDRFALGGWSALPTGEPVLDGSAAWVRGEVLERTPVGQSYLVSVSAVGVEQPAPTRPLVYHDRRYHAVSEQSAL